MYIYNIFLKCGAPVGRGGRWLCPAPPPRWGRAKWNPNHKWLPLSDTTPSQMGILFGCR